MAKYSVTCSCGHRDVVELFGRGTERARRIAWLENYGLCRECYTAEQNARMAAGCHEVRMLYREYKTGEYSGCKTKAKSYDPATKTVIVYVPN